MNASTRKLSIFDTFKTKTEELTGEATRQRAIIEVLVSQPNPADRTRTSISQKIATEQGIEWKNIYSGIFRDIDEILIPLGLVKEEGRLPLKRGPRALQEKGIPYYRLTRNGLLVALSLKEVGRKKELLAEFFANGEPAEKKNHDVLLKLAKVSPSFTFSLFEKYVKAFCDGKIKNLVPFSIENIKKISDESLLIQKELLEGFNDLSNGDKNSVINLLKAIS
jgi:hypothetical protein